jgi:hypothetical protein
MLVRTFVAALVVAAGTASAASTGEVDVSNLRGSQAEVAIAVDVAQPNVLFAASNSLDPKALGNLMRTYSSADGGATWSRGAGPGATAYGGKKRCNGGDPAPAIDATGRQYLAFLATACVTRASADDEDDDQFDFARLEVAARPSPAAAWRVSQVFPVRSKRLDDKPALAIDRSPASPHAGRVYVAWTRVKPGAKRGAVTVLVVVSHSDDGGATWAKPVVVPDEDNDQTFFASLAIDASGTVYVAWSTTGRNVFVDRSVDGGEHFGADVVVARRETLPYGVCGRAGSFSVPAQSERCITSAPLVVADSRAGVPERVYVTYSAGESSGLAQDVFVRPFDGALVALAASHLVHPADVNRDEFLPASAVDEAGRVWACFYDTAADASRRSVQYSCTASVDGGATWAPVRPIASVPSNETPRAASPFQFGDYEGLAVAGGVAHPIWTDARDLVTRGEEIYTAPLTAAELQLP